jgi:hypothetical protein
MCLEKHKARFNEAIDKMKELSYFAPAIRDQPVGPAPRSHSRTLGDHGKSATHGGGGFIRKYGWIIAVLLIACMIKLGCGLQ